MDKERVQRVKLYAWCQANESNYGTEYPKVVKMSHYGYEQFRSNLAKRKPYAGYEIVNNEGNVKYLKVFIKCNT